LRAETTWTGIRMRRWRPETARSTFRKSFETAAR
jgi:hypothetical protein